MFLRRSIAIAWLWCLMAPSVWALAGQAEPQGADRSEYAGRVYRDRVQPHWFGNNSQFWYRVELGRNRHEFVLVDAETGTRMPAFEHLRLARALVEAGVKEATRDNLPID